MVNKPPLNFAQAIRQRAPSRSGIDESHNEHIEGAKERQRYMSDQDEHIKQFEKRLRDVNDCFRRLLETGIDVTDTQNRTLAQFQIERNEELLNDHSYKIKGSKK